MPDEIIKFTRLFQLWSYTTSHSQLLLRSPKSSEYPTRIDVLFKNVANINLPTLLSGLTVNALSESEAAHLFQQFDAQAIKGMHLFSITDTNLNGHVIAGSIAWHEDNSEYNEASVVASGTFNGKTVWPKAIDNR
jgi:hypothetical protein